MEIESELLFRTHLRVKDELIKVIAQNSADLRSEDRVNYHAKNNLVYNDIVGWLCERSKRRI